MLGNVALADQSVGLVLVVEDDRHIAALVKTYLEQEGFAVAVAHDGAEGLDVARTCDPCLVILDLMLPRIDGWEVCRRLRSDSSVPILILTARGEEVDRLLGFALTADDYVVKPFSPRELVHRVKAILRRVQPRETGGGQRLSHGALALDAAAHQATRSGRPLELTPLEFRLLESFMRHPGRVLSRETLLAHIKTQGEVVIDRVVDVHVGKLRRKIEEDPSHPHYILTVRGVGYRFNPEVEDPD
jgi:DNA-binding response OmpR family regulator